MTFEYHPEKLTGLVPDCMHEVLRRYFEHGVYAGRTLDLILTDASVSEVFASADSETIAALPGLLKWLYNSVPALAWGSKVKVLEWIADGGIAGHKKWAAE